MSVCQVFTEFRFIFVMHFKKKFIETETTESRMFSLLQKENRKKMLIKYTVPCTPCRAVMCGLI